MEPEARDRSFEMHLAFEKRREGIPTVGPEQRKAEARGRVWEFITRITVHENERPGGLRPLFYSSKRSAATTLRCTWIAKCIEVDNDHNGGGGGGL